MIFGGQPKVEFTCSPELHGVIPEPVPARTYMPDWFKNLKQYTKDFVELTEGEFNGKTAKRCPPILDTLTTGWIIPLQTTVTVKTNHDCSWFQWSQSKIPAFEAHGTEQIDGHPMLPRPPIKALNQWHIKTPPGWSTLFVAPLNRDNDIFQAIPGIVDTDKFTENINFPGFFVKPDMNEDLKAGFPVVQAIPFKRGMDKKAIVRSRTEKEEAVMLKKNNKYGNVQGLYRDKWWVKK